MRILRPSAALLISALAACSGGGGSDPLPPGSTDLALVSTRSSSFDSYAVSLIQTVPPYAATNNLNASASEQEARANGSGFFLIEKFMADFISRVDLAAPTTRVYRYSTNQAGESGSSNPYDILVASPTKAYVLRYGSGALWIVNPSATNEAAFKTGEIDLSGFDTFDGIPEMSAGRVLDGRLYVALQRLENFAAAKSGQVVVIDTNTDTVVGSAIDLPIRNPEALVPTGDGDLLVQGSGGFDGSFNTVFESGIARIDTDSATVTAVLDDGDGSAFGVVEDVAVADPARGYFIGSTGFFGSQTLYRFNLDGTGTPQIVSGYSARQLGSIGIDPDGRLWVALTDDAAPGVSVLGFVGGTETVLQARIDTGLVPNGIDFLNLTSR